MTGAPHTHPHQPRGSISPLRAYLIQYGGSRQIIDARSHDDAIRLFHAKRRYQHGRAPIKVRLANPLEVEAFRRPQRGDTA